MRLIKIVLSGLFATALCASAFADDVVTLRMGTHNAVTEPGVTEDAAFFVKEVERLSKGSIKIDLYPGEQAGKANQMFNLVKSGAVDIGDIATGYTSGEQLPLVGTWEIPGLAQKSCDIVKAMQTLGQPGGLIFEKNFKPNNLRMLIFAPYPPYAAAASRVKITKIEDLKGLKIRTAGGLMDIAVQKIGGTPVKMTAPEIYEGLQRGTVDSVFLSYISVRGLGLAPVGKFGTTGFSFGQPGDMYGISEERFNSLSKEHQQVLIDAGRATSEHWCNYVDNNEAKAMADLRAAGMEIHAWSADDVAKLKALTADVPAEWAKKVSDRGLPGKEVLEQFRKLVAQN